MKYLARLREELAAALAGQSAAYEIGYAQGELAGAAKAFACVEQTIYQRRGIEATVVDVEVARKGSTH